MDESILSSHGRQYLQTRRHCTHRRERMVLRRTGATNKAVDLPLSSGSLSTHTFVQNSGQPPAVRSFTVGPDAGIDGGVAFCIRTRSAASCSIAASSAPRRRQSLAAVGCAKIVVKLSNEEAPGGGGSRKRMRNHAEDLVPHGQHICFIKFATVARNLSSFPSIGRHCEFYGLSAARSDRSRRAITGGAKR
jgi:hypothetical protein